MNSESVGDLSRRSVLFGAIAVVAVSADDCLAAENPEEVVARNARLVADSMKAIHGGSWNINISHALGVISITKQVRRDSC